MSLARLRNIAVASAFALMSPASRRRPSERPRRCELFSHSGVIYRDGSWPALCREGNA